MTARPPRPRTRLFDDAGKLNATCHLDLFDPAPLPRCFLGSAVGCLDIAKHAVSHYWKGLSMSTTASPPVAATPLHAEGGKAPIRVGALQVRFLVEPDDSNGSVSCFECYVPAQGMMPAPHSHDAFEETIYGLDGVTTWTVDGQVREIGMGDALCLPRGAVHGFDNQATEDAMFLAISTPGVMRPDYFREVHAVLAE